MYKAVDGPSTRHIIIVFLVFNGHILDVQGLKANMNSYISLETTVIFFSSGPLSKIGHWLGVCHG